jgi:hypothetical protein
MDLGLEIDYYPVLSRETNASTDLVMFRIFIE